MSMYGPGPTLPPRPTPPPPSHDNRNARIAVISLLTVLGFVVPELLDRDENPEPPGPGPTTPVPDSTSPVPDSPSPPPDSPSPTPDDGLTEAQRELRDSLNEDQWQLNSCEPDTTTIPGAKAALRCTLTTDDETYGPLTDTANIALYKTQDEMRGVFRTYTGGLPKGDCSQASGYYGVWHENTSTEAGGDVACYVNTNYEYVIACTYYDRPAILLIRGSDYATLFHWWTTIDPVFAR